MSVASPPTVVTVSPAQGSTAGGTLVTVTGSGFTGATSVLFGGVGANFNAVNDSKLTVYSPLNRPAGSVDVQVNTNAGGLSPINLNDRFTYVQLPIVKGVSPQLGPNAGNTPVTISGSGFTGALSVLFGTVPATGVTVNTNGTVITATSPEGTGTVDITVWTSIGASATCGADQFRYATLPLYFNVSSDLAVPGVYMTMFGTLYAGSYTNSYGTAIAKGSGVILIATGSGFDYVPINGLSAGSPLPPFLTTSTALVNFPVNIPNVMVDSQRVVIGLGTNTDFSTAVASPSNGQSLPQETINVQSTAGFQAQGGMLYIPTSTGLAQVSYETAAGTSFTGCRGGTGTLQTGAPVLQVNLPTPQVNTAGAVTAPTPGLAGSNIYDFFEFSYDDRTGALTLTANTSAIDQFGIPIILDIVGGSVVPYNKVGVIQSRATVIGTSGNGSFAEYVAGTPYAVLAQDGFGNPTTVRILSPPDHLTGNPVQGVTATDGTASGNLEPQQNYYYAVTAVQAGKEALASATLVQRKAPTSGSIQLDWQGSADYTYKIYRGQTIGNEVFWDQAGTSQKAPFTDTGTRTPGKPNFDPLASYFDPAIEELFSTYHAREATIVLTTTDGSNPANGIQYNFTGRVTDASGWLSEACRFNGRVIQFTCKSIENNGDNPGLIPLNSVFFVFEPFFNTNRLSSGYPSPPSWNGSPMHDCALAPTGMVFGGNGVFADNVQQSAALYDDHHIEPAGLDQNAYSVALGALEDMLDAALLRGIATTMNSVNWANAPTNNAAVPGSANGDLLKTYYYVVTALNAQGESTPSNEASSPAGTSHSNALSWAPVKGATGYNVYRGTEAGLENQLVAHVLGQINTSFSDTKVVYPVPAEGPPTSPPTSGPVTPAPALNSAELVSGGGLALGGYTYVMTALSIGGESVASNSMPISITQTGLQSVKLSWSTVVNASAYKVYRSSGSTQSLVGIIQGNPKPLQFTDTGGANQNPPPNIYYAPGSRSDLYAQFFHQTSVSYGGLAYTHPFDDQGGQSSTLAARSPQSITVTRG